MTNSSALMRLARAVLLWLGVVCGALGATNTNILILLGDDLGYGELGCQGNKEIPTPHIDSIAKHGIRFTQGYVSAPVCSPTRAGLMTGRYQTRFGHEFNGVGPRFGLPLSEMTIADRFKALGYATCVVGKWHLGTHPQFRPTRRGFDEFYGTLGNTSYFRPQTFIDTRESDEVKTITEEGFYTTEAYAKRAVDWLERHKDEPWFLYVPFNAQHMPLQAREKYLERFPHINDPKRRLFAAVLSAMDDAVGRILQKVRELGQEQKTLVIYFSDNGGPTRSTTSHNGPLRGVKATTWEGGIRIPFLMQWKGTLPAGTIYEQPIVQLDLLPTALAAAEGNVESDWQLDGVNLLPYLKGENTGVPHEALYWRMGGQWAIRDGDWKLVVANGGGGEPELYNLADNISESHNRAADQPQKLKELRELWEKWNAEQIPPAWP